MHRQMKMLDSIENVIEDLKLINFPSDSKIEVLMFSISSFTIKNKQVNVCPINC